MQYLTHRRFKGKCICGEVNLPVGTECELRNGVLFWGDKPLCYEKSENSHQYFARNDDGNAILRGQLTQGIMKHLNKRDDHYQERWDKVWEDPVCQPYKRTEQADYWLWNHEFFGADILTLRHIATLIGLKERK